MTIEQIIAKAAQALALSWFIRIATRTHLQAFSIRQVLPMSTIDQLTLIIAIKRIVGITFCAVAPRVGGETVGRHGETAISDIYVTSLASFLSDDTTEGGEV